MSEVKTLRDEFAMASLAGMNIGGDSPEVVADWAYLYADALMEKRGTPALTPKQQAAEAMFDALEAVRRYTRRGEDEDWGAVEAQVNAAAVLAQAQAPTSPANQKGQ